MTRTQDLASYLSDLYAAVERYGSPEALVTGWLKAMRLEGYAPSAPRRPEELQQALFAHDVAWG